MATRKSVASKSARNSGLFKTNRRIRLGIWGLGRGSSFYKACAAVNIDVVAGCDYNQHMRDGFLEAHPGAFVTADADEFLAQDFDAVLLATFCPSHGPDAIRCLNAGKHVLSEVTAFFTMAEGVALVEAVEKSGKVYNLAENYPFQAANMWLAEKWRTGLFGKLMYAEFEYVHETRSLCYTYIDGKPVQPGHHLHAWRSWLRGHYYCTHSLGPVMYITGERPTRVVSLTGGPTIAGLPKGDGKGKGKGGVATSLITMSNGSVVRNLMGGTTNDTNIQRLWGTLGAAEQNIGAPLRLRLGATGHSPLLPVKAKWDKLGELAMSAGHGGGDFWVLYFFARQILTGEPAPFDIYNAADVTIPGIQSLRSADNGGAPMDCPDFRDPKQRDQYRDDHWQQEKLDPKNWAFPADADPAITGQFSTIVKAVIRLAPLYRAYADWVSVMDAVDQPSKIVAIIDQFTQAHPEMVKVYREARAMIDAYPAANAARVLREMLEDVGGEKEVLAPKAMATARKHLAALRKRGATAHTVSDFACSSVQPKPPSIDRAKLPATTTRFTPAMFCGDSGYCDIRTNINKKDGVIYLRGTISVEQASTGTLFFGADGPFKIWLNRKPLACEPKASGPVVPSRYSARVKWKKGVNEVLFAVDTLNGGIWGAAASALVSDAKI